MRLIIVLGAGASYECWPEHVPVPTDFESIRLPIANTLFAPLRTQNFFLERYKLMGIASPLRSKAKTQGNKFDIEAELEEISTLASSRRDLNTLQNLFKSRFYIHSLIRELTIQTINHTSGHTIYVDLLAQLKQWIDQSPDSRIVDIVTFNYDDLLEKAMENVYNYDWVSKNSNAPLSAYYAGRNLHIYKPHGSINWGREILKDDSHFSYSQTDEIFREFNNIELCNSFQFVDPAIFDSIGTLKNCIPAVAVPFKGKTNFDECPQEMQVRMLEAINGADKIITIGWKGADEHFTKLFQNNNKIDDVYVVSPSGQTHLDKIFSSEKIKPQQSTFRDFVSTTSSLELLLETLN